MREIRWAPDARRSARLFPRLFLGLLPALSLLAPWPATAQDPLGTPVREARDMRALIMLTRAEIGVVLGDAVEVAGRTGVRVTEVRPGGPAERAGVRVEDVILAMDGETLGPEPARRVVQLMGGVEAGDTVALAVRRDGQELTVRVVAERGRLPRDLGARIREEVMPARAEVERLREALRGARVEGIRIDAEALREQMIPARAEAERVREALRAMALPAVRGLDLVELNPRLGRYFGVDAGILVADVPPDSPLGLEPGDVIVSIDGRTPRDRAHARSILASYRTDEEIELRVVRDRRTITVRAAPGAR
jgi:predicted metalloprotease with PDZ domain